MIFQDIVTSKIKLNDLKHLTQLLHTGTLKIYHALYNKCAPKSQDFFYTPCPNAPAAIQFCTGD